jgi:hypothetical protein
LKLHFEVARHIEDYRLRPELTPVSASLAIDRFGQVVDTLGLSPIRQMLG